MRWAGLAAAAVVMSAGSAGAAEPSAFDIFRAICLDHLSDSGGAIQSAAALGFVPDTSVPFAGPDQLTATVGGQAIHLIVSDDAWPIEGGGGRVATCSILVETTDEGPLLERAQAWAGFPATPGPKEWQYFAFQTSGDARVQVKDIDLPDGVRRLSDDQADLLMVQKRESGVVIGVMTWSQGPAR